MPCSDHPYGNYPPPDTTHERNEREIGIRMYESEVRLKLLCSALNLLDDMGKLDHLTHSDFPPGNSIARRWLERHREHDRKQASHEADQRRREIRDLTLQIAEIQTRLDQLKKG